MNFILADSAAWKTLLPLTYTRPVAEIRIGISTLTEKWEWYLANSISYLTQPYLQGKFPLIEGDQNLVIDSSFIPNGNGVAELLKLEVGSELLSGDKVIARCLDQVQFEAFKADQDTFKAAQSIESKTGMAAVKSSLGYFPS